MITAKVSSLSMIFMGISVVLSVAIPIILLIYFRKKHGAAILPFFVGCGVMLVFALILESLVHRVVLGSSAGETIMSNMWLYALYGGCMAGLFEESGRFIAFSTLLKKYQSNDANALMYGAGHGGFEAVALLGTTMVVDLVLSVLINAGMLDMIPELASGEAAQAMDEVVSQLTDAPPYFFLVGIIERIFAIAMHISFSVLVWFAVKEKGSFILFPVAILLHAAVDAVTVLVSQSGAGNAVTEVVIGAMAVITVIVAKTVWNRHKREQIAE